MHFCLSQDMSEHDTRNHKVTKSPWTYTKYGILADAFYMHFESPKQ